MISIQSLHPTRHANEFRRVHCYSRVSRQVSLVLALTSKRDVRPCIPE